MLGPKTRFSSKTVSVGPNNGCQETKVILPSSHNHGVDHSTIGTHPYKARRL